MINWFRKFYNLKIFLFIIILILVIKYFLDYREFKLKEINYLTKISSLIEENLNKNLEIKKLNDVNSRIREILVEEQNKNQFFEKQINFAKEKIGELYKFAALDKELLKKYSKVYFLNENYAPQKLSLIDSKYVYNKSGQNIFIAMYYLFWKN